MFDTNQSKTIDLFLETPEEEPVVLNDDHIREELKLEDELDTFKDFEFIEMIRSGLRDMSETTGEDRDEIAVQLPYAPLKQKIVSRILRLLGWRYFHRVDDVEFLEDIESLKTGVKYTTAEESDAEKFTAEEEEEQDTTLADLLTLEEEEETGQIHRIAKRYFLIDVINKIRKKFFRSNLVIGFDIGSEYVKFTQLRQDKYNFVLDRYRIQDIGRKQDDTPEIFRSKAVLALQKVLPFDLLTMADSTVSITNLPVAITTETLPFMDKNELHEAIMFRARKAVPENIKDPDIHYEIIEKSDSEETSQFLVRTYIVDKTELSDWIQALHECKIDPVKITFPHKAIQYNLSKFHPREMFEGVTVFDFGGAKSQLVFADKGTIKLIRNIDVGVDEFIDVLTGTVQVEDESIAINRKMAEDLLRTYGISGTHSVGNTKYGIPIAQIGIMLFETVEKFIVELQRSIDYYRSTFPDSPITSILVTGGGSEIINLFDLLEEKLGIPVKQFSYLQKLTIGRDIAAIDELIQDSYMLTGSVGLALDQTFDLNILPKQAQNRKKTNLAVLGFSIAACIVLSYMINVSINVYNVLNRAEYQYNTVNSELAKRMPQRNEYFDLTNQLNTVLNLQDFIAEQFRLNSKDDSIENILRVFSVQNASEEIVINSITIHERRFENIPVGSKLETKFAPRKIVLKGKTLAGDIDNSIVEYIIYLRNLPYFDRITPQPYQGEEYTDERFFQISMYLRESLLDGSE